MRRGVKKRRDGKEDEGERERVFCGGGGRARGVEGVGVK